MRKDFPDCGCKDGYFPRELQRVNRCLKCPLPCRTCSDELTCITLDCSNAITGEYFVSDGGIRCEKCPYPCETCEDITGVCISNFIKKSLFK